MGRRSINTTKSGKYMNPTDQFSKCKKSTVYTDSIKYTLYIVILVSNMYAVFFS